MKWPCRRVDPIVIRSRLSPPSYSLSASTYSANMSAPYRRANYGDTIPLQCFPFVGSASTRVPDFPLDMKLETCLL